MYSRRYGSSGSNVPAWVVFGGVAAAVGIVFAAHYENPADAARKPAVIETMLEQSREVCSLTQDYNGASYADRYRATLNEAFTADLETIHDAGITICLDERLQEQHDGNSLFGSDLAGIYYADENVLTILDEGTGYDSFFTDRHVVGEGVPSEFADDIRDNGSITKDFSVIVRAKIPYVKQRSEAQVESRLERAPYLHEAPIYAARP
jgi:hypothetical protein